MSGAQMKFSLKDAQHRNELQRLARLDKDFTPLLKSIGEEYAGAGGIINERFKRQEDPDGDGWQPLSAKWVARRQKKMPGSPLTILRMRGDLAGSINYQTSGGNLTIGTGNEVDAYAGVHQFGSEDDKNIPARPFLGFGDSDMDIVEEEVAEFLAGG